MTPWLQRLAKRILFVRAPPAATRIAGMDDEFVMTALLNGLDRAKSLTLTNVLLHEIGPALASRKADWNVRTITVQRCVPVSHPIVWIFEATREHANASWLCDIVGQPPPPPYHLDLCPLFEAMIEFRFAAPPSAGVIAELRAILDAPVVFDPPVLLGSGLQVRVYDSHSTTDVAKRVNICFLVRRPPGVTRAACQSYWRHQHAELALQNMRYLRLTRYRQVHTTAEPLPGLDDTFDGVVYAEKRSYAQLTLDLLKPNTARFNNTVVVDECHFTDATPVMLMHQIATW